jgi:hypothetical protein
VWLVTVAHPVIRVAFKLFPSVRARIANTLPGRAGTVIGLLQRKQYAEAYQRAFDGAQYCESQRSASDAQMPWWSFMKFAAQSASELGDTERQAVLARLGSAPEPGGLEEAHTLHIVSRWRWQSGARDGAIEFARRAVLADPTWPQGHILLAWYGLVSGKFDPLPRLREAVRVSPSCLEQIRANTEFAKFPELLAALTSDS